MAVSIIGPKFYAWDSDTGAPLAFGKVFTYQAGTNTPKATFQSEDGVTANANPTILNGAGYANIYLDGSYKVVVKDADDVEVWTSDPVTDPSGLQKEWINGRAATQVSPTSFSIVGNHTDVYTAGKALQLDDASYLYGYVDSVTYVGGNTVVEVLSDDPLTGSLTRSWTGIVGMNSLPQFQSGSSESLQAADILVTVGAGGDYPTIKAALEYLSKLQPVYDFAGITATINLLSGFVMAEQVLVRGLDLGWITITGADAETTITNTALTTDFTTADYGSNSYPAFGVSKGGVLPRIDQRFRFDVANTYSNKQGIMAVGAGSSADVLAGAGVNDAGTHGIIASRGSTINAEGADASGAGANGIIADDVSTVNAAGADASGAGYYGIFARGGSTINASSADASGAGNNGISAFRSSTINAEEANASGAEIYGISAVTGSTVNAAGADASGAGTYGIFADNGSTINADTANASSAGKFGIFADDGSTINAEEANASVAGTNGIVADNGSTINADGADASGAENHGIYANDGSTISAASASASGAGSRGIYAYRGSTINADGADATGAGINGILASRGSTINADGADASGAIAIGIYAASGSTINADGATGTLSQSTNTVTRNGIIFQ